MNRKQLIKILVFAGAIPFVCGIFLRLTGQNFMGLDGESVLLSYGAVIISFLSGLHWSLGMQHGGNLGGSSLLLIISNITALGGWFALLIGGTPGMVMMTGLFLALLGLDSRLKSVLGDDFFKLRIIITAVVVFCLMVGGDILIFDFAHF